MDHVKALNERSAERYVLGEMSAAEAEEFERHYFDCQECALAVEEGQVLAANARAVLAAEPEEVRHASAQPGRESFWGSMRAWWNRPGMVFATAACLLAALSLYQGAVVIPGLHQELEEARLLPAFQLIGASRGSASKVTVPPGTPSFALAADIPPDARFPRYLCELMMGGRAAFSLTASTPAVGQPITILVPTKNLPAGHYELMIYGLDTNTQQRTRVSTLAFVLEYQ